MSATWLITRPIEDAAPDAAVLGLRGIEAEPWPVLERYDVAWDGQLGEAGLVLLTSTSVLPALLRAWEGWSVKPKIAAMGPVTAAQARELGLPVHVEAPGGAEALIASVLARWGELGAPRAVLWPTSAAGVERGEQTRAVVRLELHAHVHRVPVVALRRPADLERRAKAIRGGERWLLASPSAAEILVVLGLPAPSAVLCHGHSTAATYAHFRPEGWPEPMLGRSGLSVVEAVIEAESAVPARPRPLGLSAPEPR